MKPSATAVTANLMLVLAIVLFSNASAQENPRQHSRAVPQISAMQSTGCPYLSGQAPRSRDDASASDVSSPCPYLRYLAQMGEQSTGCPYLDGMTGCPYLDESNADEDGDEEGCPYLNEQESSREESAACPFPRDAIPSLGSVAECPFVAGQGSAEQTSTTCPYLRERSEDAEHSTGCPYLDGMTLSQRVQEEFMRRDPRSICPYLRQRRVSGTTPGGCPYLNGKGRNIEAPPNPGREV